MEDRLIKKRRLGPLLVDGARRRCGYNSAHAFLGGTGAVGGAAVYQMLSLYEEMFAIEAPADSEVPWLLTTGRVGEDLEIFTHRLFRITLARHVDVTKDAGDSLYPKRIKGAGYLTHSGVFIGMERLNVSLLPQLEGAHFLQPAERAEVVERALQELRAHSEAVGAESADAFEMLRQVISRRRPFYSFLREYAETRLENYDRRFASVIVGIPLPSLVAYHSQALRLLAEEREEFTAEGIEELRDLFVDALHADLVAIKNDLADVVLIAHTTGVGGMLDEVAGTGGATTSVRLGFAHAAQDEFLAQKHEFAKRLGRRYAESGLLVLTTAAAIGVDEVRIDQRVPLHPKVVQQLFDADGELFKGAKELQPAESRASLAAGKRVPVRQYVRVHRPITLRFPHPPRSEKLKFERGDDLCPRYSLRSGENGFFSVANAEALYRVMRVASASELGAVLARVGLFGDDPNVPWFVDCICNYTETDYSRQVFDFLGQPELMESQIGGLEPMALQDLGSSKHQSELHMLGLLILLHRLRTLDLNAIDPYVNVDHFDARRFFLERSRALTFEDLRGWDAEGLSRQLTQLVTAGDWKDLLALNREPSKAGLFEKRDVALEALLGMILEAVWAIPSLGTPVVFSGEHGDAIRTGYFVGPLDLVIEKSDSLHRTLAKQYEAVRGSGSYEEFLDFFLCDRGFLDIRPHAILSTAQSLADFSSGKVSRYETEKELRTGLAAIEPFSRFTTCGLVAVLYRLRQLHKTLSEALTEFGTWPEFRWQMPRDGAGHTLLLPGACEAFRMFSEGLEKTTGLERLDGPWGYGYRQVADRREEILDAIRHRTDT